MFKRRKPDEPVPPGQLRADQAAAAANPGATSDAPFLSDAEGQDAAPGAPDQVEARRQPADTGLGVPPYRPAVPKEPLQMARPPFSNTPAPSPSTQPLGMSPSGMNQPGLGQPGARPANLSVPPPSASQGTAPGSQPGSQPVAAERRTLVVGRGISVQGTVQDAERLVVEGTVEASMIRATELSVSLGGVFKGEIEVEDAEVAGTIDGTVTARGSLIVRATGRVLGTAHCRRLQVEDGGQITGRIEMINEGTTTAPAPASVPRPVEAL